VAVVGAGVGGLAAAARLAAGGHDVTVFERSGAVGGKLGTLERAGFRFDTGPSLLTMPQVFNDLFADTGAPLKRVLDLELVDPTARYRFADGTWLDASANREQFYADLDATLAPGSGAQWRGFLDRAERVWNITRGPFLEAPIAGPATLARLAWNVPQVRAVAPWLTLRALGERQLGDPRLRMFLDRYATYTGSDPRRAPAALAMIPYVEQAFGGWYILGGLHRLAEAIAARAVDRGATVRTGAEVVEVTTSGRRVDGVRLADGEAVPTDIVVANVDARRLYGGLVRHRRVDAPRRRLASVPPSLAGFVLLLGLRGRTPGLTHHTVLFPADYDAELTAVFDFPAPVADPTIYVVSPDDPAVRPNPASEAWFVLVNAPPHDPGAGVDWDAPGLATAYADRVLAVLADRGLDVRDRIVLREIRTPADLERDTGSVGGSIYGSSSNGPRAAFLRPANRSPVPGLFLVGGSAHPGGGLPLVTLSAAIVARLIGPA
jgi:phytoene desaturase